MTSCNTSGPPLVSVIMPCYKMGALIGGALASISAQDFRNWELIVVDDCGPEDGTREQVEEFATRHAGRRVEFIRHEANLGVCAARRTALTYCHGEYVAFLDPDDEFFPEKLERQIGIMENEPAVILCHTAIECIGQRDPEFDVAGWFRMSDAPLNYAPVTRGGVLAHNKICNSSVLCRASALTKDDLPDSMVFQFEDKLLWSRLAARGKFYYLPDPLVKYRVHPESFTTRILKRHGAHQLADLELCLRFEQSDRFSVRKLARYGYVWSQLAYLAGAPQEGGWRSRCKRLAFDFTLISAGLASMFRAFFRGRR